MERSRDEFRKRLLADSLSERFGRALLTGDSQAAEQIARDALELTLGEAMLYDLVVGPAMHRIGELWAAGEIGVGHEHLATQIATRVLALAHDAAGLTASRAEHRAILAAVEGEHHVVALDMAAKLLESAGYEVFTLGADVPTDALPAVVSRVQADPVRALRDDARDGRALPGAVEAITGTDPGVGLILGGTSVPSSTAIGPRVALEPSVAGIVDAADGLIRRARLN